MPKAVILSIALTLVISCAAPTPLNPPGNPSPTPELDLSGRVVQLPPNQPFKYFVVAAGVIQVGGVAVVGGRVGPSYNNLRVSEIGNGRFVVTYDGYAQPDENSNLIVKALAEGVSGARGPYVVSFQAFQPFGVELSLHDLRLGGPPANVEAVKVMVEISQFVRTN